MAKVSQTLVAATFAILAVAGVVYVASAVGVFGTKAEVSGTTAVTSAVVGGVAQNVVPVSKLSLCQGINTLSLFSAARNPLNSSTQYFASGFRVVPTDSSVIAATGTGNAGSSLSYATVSIPCDESAFEGTLYAVSSTTLNGAKVHYNIKGTAGYSTMAQTQGDELRLTIMNTGLRSVSANQTQSPTEEAATAMNAGDSRTTYLDVYPGDFAFSQFGGDVKLEDVPALQPYINFNPGILVVVDTVDSAAFTDNAVSLSGTAGLPLVEIPSQVCSQAFPKAYSVLSGNRCYIAPPVTTKYALQRTSVSLVADGGANPGATSDPTINFCDLQYIEEVGAGATGVRVDCYDLSGTDAGQGNSVVTLDNS